MIFVLILAILATNFGGHIQKIRNWKMFNFVGSRLDTLDTQFFPGNNLFFKVFQFVKRFFCISNENNIIIISNLLNILDFRIVTPFPRAIPKIGDSGPQN